MLTCLRLRKHCTLLSFLYLWCKFSEPTPSQPLIHQIFILVMPYSSLESSSNTSSLWGLHLLCPGSQAPYPTAVNNLFPVCPMHYKDHVELNSHVLLLSISSSFSFINTWFKVFDHWIIDNIHAKWALAFHNVELVFFFFFYPFL